MKRDFTAATKAQILKHVENFDNVSIWQKIWDGITDVNLIVKWLFEGRPQNSDGEKEINAYYDAIVDIKDYSVSVINKIFREANRMDRVYAEKLNEKYKTAVILNAELKELIDIITPNSFENPNLTETAIGKHGAESRVRVSDGVVVSNEIAISNDEVINHCNNLKGDYYREIYRNVNDALGNMGIGTVLLIAVLGHTEININNLLYSVDGIAFLEYIKKEILKGRKGYDSVKSIAEKLGVEEDYVRYMLGDKSVRKPFEYNRYGFQYEVQLNQILQDNINKAIEDEAFLEEICKEFGLDRELTNELLHGKTIDGYSIKQYQSCVAEAVAAACEKIKLEIYPDEFADVLSGIKELIESGAGEGTKDVIEAWRKGELNNKQAVYFLETFCGYDSVELKDIKRLNEIAYIFDKFDLIDEIGNVFNIGIENVALWISNYDAEIKLLENMMTSENSNSSYKIALNTLKTNYEEKWTKTMSDIIEYGVEKGVDALKGYIPGLSLAETAIELVGKVTGAEGYADAAQEIIGLSGILEESVDVYYESVERVRNGDHSEDAIMDVRMSFEMMKQTSINYYDAQIRYAEGICPGTMKYNSYLEYLKYERGRIQRMELGDDYKPMSYEKYLKL